jgi:hypothetical protein
VAPTWACKKFAAVPVLLQCSRCVCLIRHLLQNEKSPLCILVLYNEFKSSFSNMFHKSIGARSVLQSNETSSIYADESDDTTIVTALLRIVSIVVNFID